MNGSHLKIAVGCWFTERWRAECAVWTGHRRGARFHWSGLHNRDEVLRRVAGGWECRWPDSSWLTVARVFPGVGARLLCRCLKEWPVRLGDALPPVSRPRVSVVLPVGGRDRVPLLAATLRSFMGQSYSELEVIVVEYGEAPLLESSLPSGVRHVFEFSRGDEFNKSRAFNCGALMARGDIILLHDADVVVPCRYVESIAEAFAEGWEAVRPVRFLFHLSREATPVFAEALDIPGEISDVQQNNPGISSAVLRSVYFEIGGHDERFEGWGGEDNEFLDRLKTRRLCPGAWMPAVHLWHASAPRKASGDRNRTLAQAIRAVPVHERIGRLVRLGQEDPRMRGVQLC